MKTECKHVPTPGPWTIETKGTMFEAMVVGPDGARTILFQGNMANARLIAAAPDLLEACKNVKYIAACIQNGRWEDTCWDTIADEMYAAIAKAEGKL